MTIKLIPHIHNPVRDKLIDILQETLNIVADGNDPEVLETLFELMDRHGVTYEVDKD